MAAQERPIQEQPNIAEAVISPKLSAALEVPEGSASPQESVDDQQMDMGNGTDQESQETNHLPLRNATLF